MQLETIGVLRCPECSVMFKPDESTSIFVVGDCPSCKKNIRPERFYLVHDAQLKPKPVKKPAPAKPETKGYTCSKCGQKGHNARTCSNDKEKVHDAFKKAVNDPEVIEKVGETVEELRERQAKENKSKPWAPREYEAVKDWIIAKSSYPSAIDAIALNLDISHSTVLAICLHLDNNEPGFNMKDNIMIFIKGKRL